MPTEDQSRLLDAAARPLVADLWRALAGLGSTVGFLNTGAHPDDETSGMLAALWLRDGVNLSYACATRGEGGQNDIGTEGGAVLGTLRTAEMERAAEALDMRLYWLGTGPDDPIADFGFSKSGEETMARWGRDRLLRRFVEVLRTERPDIVCPTFLDIPGQHGHHRAMTAAAEEAVGLAADPAYGTGDLPAWSVAKLYLPAWSGAGGAYDDEVPPPPATVTVAGAGVDPMLGLSYAQVGQVSRQYHRTQGMGRWVSPGAETDWPLHLKSTAVGPDTGAVTGNLPSDLGQIGLPEAQRAVDACRAAFPDRAAVAAAAMTALGHLHAARPDPAHAHRVARKIAQLGRVVRIAEALDVRGVAEAPVVPPGDSTAVAITHRAPSSGSLDVALHPGPGQTADGAILTVAPDAPVADPYPTRYDPLDPPAPALSVAVAKGDVHAVSRVALATPVLVLPPTRARLSTTGAILNLARPGREIDIEVTDRSPGTPAFDLPQGWRQTWNGDTATITVPDDAAADLTTLPLTIDAEPAATVQHLRHGHTAPRLYHAPATLDVRLAHIAVPEARIAYIGAGTDSVARWLCAAGLDLVEMTDADLAAEAPFAGYDTVLVGVFAVRFRPALKPLLPKLNAWVRDGGTLVTLYHRPWDDWDPDRTPPARLEIGQPSLRWRITDEAAEVTVLADHPALSTPNAIGPEDWAGWRKERGLYFAKAWAPDYIPLLRMADPGDAPLDGSLLVGEIGAGRHVHVALNLHHQVTQLVPGAYRLFANLLTPRR